VELGFKKPGRPLSSTGAGLLNHQTSKNSTMSFWMRIFLWVYKIRGFEGGSGVPKCGGPFNSTGAGLLNYQASIISINSVWMKILLFVIQIRGFEGGIWVQKNLGDPLIRPGQG
jgi:hypothetical protein